MTSRLGEDPGSLEKVFEANPPGFKKLWAKPDWKHLLTSIRQSVAVGKTHREHSWAGEGAMHSSHVEMRLGVVGASHQIPSI